MSFRFRRLINEVRFFVTVKVIRPIIFTFKKKNEEPVEVSELRCSNCGATWESCICGNYVSFLSASREPDERFDWNAYNEQFQDASAEEVNHYEGYEMETMPSLDVIEDSFICPKCNNRWQLCLCAWQEEQRLLALYHEEQADLMFLVQTGMTREEYAAENPRCPVCHYQMHACTCNN